MRSIQVTCTSINARWHLPLSSLLYSTRNSPEALTTLGFSELPGDLRYSELHFFCPYQDIHYHGVAKTFAWLNGAGIYHGNLVFGSQNVGDSVIDMPHLLPYPATLSAAVEFPISIALTEFHFILLYKERIRAVNQLNDQIVFDELIPLVRMNTTLQVDFRMYDCALG